MIPSGRFMTGTRFPFSITISASTSNYNLMTVLAALGYQTGPVFGTVTINSGVVIDSSSTGSYAFNTGSIPAGSIVALINNGNIYGAGGAGGAGGSSAAGAAGGAGGPAFNASGLITITNNGSIRGGGGGGGGGGGASGGPIASGGGGGGGRGSSGGSAGAAGAFVSQSGTQNQAAAGSAGTSSGAGAGGVGYWVFNSSKGGTESIHGGTGATGGDWGTAGSAGQTAYNDGTEPSPTLYGGGAGGAAGIAVQGDSNITWATLGTISGSRVG